MATNNISNAICSPSAPTACGTGNACFIELDGFMCRPNVQVGCVLSVNGLWPVPINQLLKRTGEPCTHCIIPHTTDTRQLLPRTKEGVMDDAGWRTFGNCEVGFCGFDGFCRAPKRIDSRCLAGTQCDSGICDAEGIRTDELVCEPDTISALITMPFFIAIIVMVIGSLVLAGGCTCCGVIKYRHSRKLMEAAGGGHVAPKLRLRRLILPIVNMLLGVAVLIGGIVYFFVGSPIGSPDDSNN